MRDPFNDRAEELRRERAVLSRAAKDIEEGWKRIQTQVGLLSNLQVAGHDTKQAEHLLLLLRQTQQEWERHCELIKHRISYLERVIGEVQGGLQQ